MSNEFDKNYPDEFYLINNLLSEISKDYKPTKVVLNTYDYSNRCQCLCGRQQYHGSFRTTPWDPEDLLIQYFYSFSFQRVVILSQLGELLHEL